MEGRFRMEDSQIISLFFKRDEAAISETKKKYGTFCHHIALNILSINADAEECVNDTYLQAWNTIPPQSLDRFGAWLGRVVRNIAINLWNKNKSCIIALQVLRISISRKRRL